MKNKRLVTPSLSNGTSAAGERRNGMMHTVDSVRSFDLTPTGFALYASHIVAKLRACGTTPCAF